MAKRNIIAIDESKCDGCGLCVPACEEGAIQIVDGKARVVSETYCDGLGACLGHCPQGAITIVQREAAAFDQAAVAQHLTGARIGGAPPAPAQRPCPGSAVAHLPVLAQTPASACVGAARPSTDPAPSATVSQLGNWPVQLHLVPPTAPYLRGADLLLVADCAPLACPDFHARFLDGRPVVIGCPKLDDGQAYVQKLTDMVRIARPRSITVVHMEVPCCTGLVRIAQAAVQLSGIEVPLRQRIVTIRGQVSAA